MKSSNRKLLQKIERRMRVKPISSGTVLIYNPDNVNIEQTLIHVEVFFVIALPDNRRDKELTQIIGKKFFIV